MVKTGIDRILEERPEGLKGQRIGLVSNYAVTTSALQPSIDALVDADWLTVTVLVGPEHGTWAAKVGGHGDEVKFDAHTGLPMGSLFGKSRTLPPELVQQVDHWVVDLQDIGARYYTYMNTMALCLAEAARYRQPITVLDRPNPIGGQRYEGNIIEPAFSSFVGLYPLPNRHGLTMGELARYFNTRMALGADLTVVPMLSWERSMLWSDTGLPFCPPSLNVTGLNMMLLYPGTCLFEGTNVSLGRGTAWPFEVLGAPYIDGHQLADALNARGLPGIKARPLQFIPVSHIYAGELCSGVALHVLDHPHCDAVGGAVAILEALAELYGEEFQIPRAQSTTGRSRFEVLSGTDRLASWVREGRGGRYFERGPAWSLFEADRSLALLY